MGNNRISMKAINAARHLAREGTGLNSDTIVSIGEPLRFSKGFVIPAKDKQVELWQLYYPAALDIISLWFEADNG